MQACTSNPFVFCETSELITIRSYQICKELFNFKGWGGPSVVVGEYGSLITIPKSNVETLFTTYNATVCPLKYFKLSLIKGDSSGLILNNSTNEI